MKNKKKGNNWTAFYDEDSNRYFAEIMYTSREGREQYDYEITRDIYEQLGSFADDVENERLIKTGEMAYSFENTMYGTLGPERTIWNEEAVEAMKKAETKQNNKKKKPVSEIKGGHEMKKTVDELLQCPYWIVDILPSQVPADSPGQYFTVEKYFLQGDRLKEIKQKHINLILKLNCYRDLYISDETEINPSPEHLEREMKKRYLYVMIGESMILSEPDDTHLTVFNPDAELLELIKQIALGEGLYVWQPPF